MEMREWLFACLNLPNQMKRSRVHFSLHTHLPPRACILFGCTSGLANRLRVALYTVPCVPFPPIAGSAACTFIDEQASQVITRIFQSLLSLCSTLMLLSLSHSLTLSLSHSSLDTRLHFSFSLPHSEWQMLHQRGREANERGLWSVRRLFPAPNLHL